MPPTTWHRGPYAVSTDPARLDLDVVHGFLTASYWSPGVPRETVERAARHSLAFGLYHVGDDRDAGGGGGWRQVGYARVITDRTTFGYLADVFVLPEHRRRGLAAFLMETILAHPELQGLRRWSLATRDAHGLYARFGFRPLAAPERFMERHAARPADGEHAGPAAAPASGGA